MRFSPPPISSPRFARFASWRLLSSAAFPLMEGLISLNFFSASRARFVVYEPDLLRKSGVCWLRSGLPLAIFILAHPGHDLLIKWRAWINFFAELAANIVDNKRCEW